MTFPSRSQFKAALIDALKIRGSITARDAYAEVATRLRLTSSQLKAERSGTLHYRHETRFAKLELVHEGLVAPKEQSGRGIWELAQGMFREPPTAQEVEPQGYAEGSVVMVAVNRYERDPSAREAAIRHHGCFCGVCGFDFEKMYGPMGRNVIHVHHLIPLSKVAANYKVNPVLDLLPVCPNCHEIAHRREPPFKPEEIRAMLKSAAHSAA